jgi:hypothetical protein
VVASAPLAPLIDGSVRSLHVVHRSRSAGQLADDADASERVVLSVITADAIRLPNAAVVPSFPRGSSPISAGDGSLGWDGLPAPLVRAVRAAMRTALLAVGHSSGRGLADGVLTVVRPDEFGAAAA